MRHCGSLIVLLLCILLLAQVSFPLSKVGETCNYTKDCGNGYCLDGVCILPEVNAQRNLTACTATADCGEGYCVEGICTLPTLRGDIFGLGIRSGCAGLLEETGAFGSFAICEAIWVLVFLLSASATYASYKRRNPWLATAAVLLLPLFLALILLPFLGILVALLELAVILGKKKYR